MKVKNEKTAKSPDFRLVLRKAGYKSTPSRLAVLEVFRRSKQPLSAQAVIDQVAKDIDQATVYRIIKTLKKISAIRQIDFRHNHAHYELSDTEDHHHLICLSCGRAEEIMGCEIDSMKKKVLQQTRTFREITDHSLEFYGICSSCGSMKE